MKIKLISDPQAETGIDDKSIDVFDPRFVFTFKYMGKHELAYNDMLEIEGAAYLVVKISDISVDCVTTVEAIRCL